MPDGQQSCLWSSLKYLVPSCWGEKSVDPKLLRICDSKRIKADCRRSYATRIEFVQCAMASHPISYGFGTNSCQQRCLESRKQVSVCTCIFEWLMRSLMNRTKHESPAKRFCKICNRSNGSYYQRVWQEGQDPRITLKLLQLGACRDQWRGVLACGRIWSPSEISMILMARDLLNLVAMTILPMHVMKSSKSLNLYSIGILDNLPTFVLLQFCPSPCMLSSRSNTMFLYLSYDFQ